MTQVTSSPDASDKRGTRGLPAIFIGANQRIVTAQLAGWSLLALLTPLLSSQLRC